MVESDGDGKERTSISSISFSENRWAESAVFKFRPAPY
jgi:hypothetical protein